MVIVTDGYFDLKENEIAKEIIFFKKNVCMLTKEQSFSYQKTPQKPKKQKDIKQHLNRIESNTCSC